MYSSLDKWHNILYNKRVRNILGGRFMSTWNDIKKSVGLIAEKTAIKTRELTDTASLKIKIASREADRDTEYKRLGKLTYTKLKSNDK